MKKVLIIEKQLTARDLLMHLLKREERQLFSVEDGVGALELLKKRTFDLISATNPSLFHGQIANGIIER